MKSTVTPFRRKPPVSPPPSEVDYDIPVDSLWSQAQETLAAEQQIKEELLRAARAGERERVVAILESWIANPVAAEVAAGMER